MWCEELEARDTFEKESRMVARSSLGNMLMTDLLANTFMHFLVEEIYLEAKPTSVLFSTCLNFSVDSSLSLRN